MNIRSHIFALACISTSIVFAVDTNLPPGFAVAVANSSKQYRDAVAVVVNNANAGKHLDGILEQEPPSSVIARHARILLARIEHPEVFADFANEIQKWREGEKSSRPRGGLPGFLSGILMQFVKRGPESKYIDQKLEWKSEELKGDAGNTLTVRRMEHKKVKKYTDAEVAAGIARNAAARQAVLEHFLKFLDEGDAYEQSEIVLLVNRLWGHGRLIRTGDLAIIDHVQDVDALLESVFQDRSRPMIVRMSAVFCLPNAAPSEVQAFMLNVVTNTPPEDRYFQVEAMVGTALNYLESSADPAALAILKSQTNGPTWKLGTAP